MFIEKEIKDKIISVAEKNLLEVIEHNIPLVKKGANRIGTCPFCDADKSFNFHEGKNIFKCWKCGQGGNSAVSFYMKQGKSYPEALELLARQFSILIDEPKRSKKQKSKSKKESYCSKMLKDSGLTTSDVRANVFNAGKNHTTTISNVFKPGSFNSKNEIVEGDDVIIEYYDLEGFPVRFTKELKNTTITQKYYRVRWQFPEEHLNKEGKPMKYKSPAGSGSFVYIPQKIRDLYRERKTIPRLFIQEGEKKAEKACKHNIPSVAISGIQNLGKNGKLHEDLITLIEVCEVKELVLVFDADWNDLSSSITLKKSADLRPRSFFWSARNFKEYCIQLKNSRNIYIDFYIGNVQPNEAKDKGIDDLLSNTLKGREDELINEIDYIFNEKEKIGKYIQFHKITTWSDTKLQELWHLQSAAVFAEVHKDILQDLPEFRIGKYLWRFGADGLLESAQPIESYEQFWEEVPKTNRDGDVVSFQYHFKYERCFRFLQNRGFYQYIKPDGNFELIRIQHPYIEVIPRYEFVRNFVKDFAREVCNEEVLEMLHRGGTQFLGPERLSNLKFYQPQFLHPRRSRQNLYFKDYFWEITADSIKQNEYSSISHQIWKDEVKSTPVKKTPKLIEVKQTDTGGFDYTITSVGKKCDFLQFLENASNFTWRKERNGATITNDPNLTSEKYIQQKEIEENKHHLISKLCAIGYLALTAKDANVARAVVAMDGRPGEVGESNGRSGKSLVGELFRYISTIAYINGKQDLKKDQFLWNDVVEKTKLVFIDDVYVNFDFELLFACISGSWNVNYKGGGRATFDFIKSPKIYLTTNHALNGEGASFRDRQWKIVFSDYYNDGHSPLDDFGTLFFSEWDFEQWNLCWNLVAQCIQLYLTFGVVQAPSERIEMRELRQSMGETFLAWAEEYFAPNRNLDKRMPKKTAFDDYIKDNPTQQKWTTATNFKAKIRKFCEYKGYIFNPQKYDYQTGLCMHFDKDGRPNDADKSGSVEHITVGTKENWEKGNIDDVKPF